MSKVPEGSAAEQEHEANMFAMALLMPEELVRREVKRHRVVDIVDDDSLKPLAKTFGVSICLMAMRLEQIYGKH